MTDSATVRDVVDLLIEDHREVESLFAELETGQGSPQRRRQVADVMIAELIRHAAAEEMYVYPTARKALPDGEQLVDHEIEEHAEVERTLADLDGMDAADPRFDTLVAQIAAAVRHHVADEESDLFPRLRAACGTDEMRELGRKVEQAKKLVPTRPHPSAPLNKMLGPGAGVIDQMRDTLASRYTTMVELTNRSH